MIFSDYQNWLDQEPFFAITAAVSVLVILFLFTRNIIAKGIISITSRTRNKVDDILVRHIRPMRVAYLAPLIAIYLLAYMLPDYQSWIEKISLFLILWIAAVTISSSLNAFNEIYEMRPGFNGVSIQSYLDIAKLLIIAVAIILSVSLFSGDSPVVLLTVFGALTAVLLLVFQNTILALVASVQINAMDLIKEGDWIEVPSYDADGDVINISLHNIKIRNFDMTFTVIPTHKIMDVAYRNWRGMQESGGRRIERSILIDMTSMRFCDDKLLDALCKIDLIHDYLVDRIKTIEQYQEDHADHNDSPLDGPQITNTELFREYIKMYLKSRTDIHHSKLPFLIRSLAPTPTGLPIELYIFTKTTKWEEYESIQSEIFDHLLAAAMHFNLRVFQEPTGMDFSTFAQGISSNKP
jgi:miniconductance mechanosensitive channel